jgi:outer membrane protein
MRKLMILLCFTLVPGLAHGESWLDYLRKYDLNDYAIGLAVTSKQNPYGGADNNTFAYPFLTSFEHPAMTDNVFVVRDGALELRRVTAGGWEFAVAGRLQTLGFGEHDSDELLGVSEPKWTIELGPSIGLRRWPLQIRLATYFEPTDRHDGIAGQLSLSYPIKWSRGYIVPSVEAIYQDSSYADYYYSVTPEEATATRMAYRPGSALNTRIKIAWAHELTDRWLLSGKISLENLADEIRDSPIVARDDLWSVNVGLAYKSGASGADGYEIAGPDSSRFELRLGAFSDNVDSRIGRDTSDGVPGDEIDLEDVLGESEKESIMQVDATWHIGRYHRIEAGFFELVRSGSATITEDLLYGNTVYSSGTDIESRSHFKSFHLGYAYSLINDDQKELGLMAGVHFSSFDSRISSLQTGELEKSSVDAPLPVVGAHASVNVGEKVVVAAKLQIFRTEFDHYSGSLNYFSIDARRQFGDRLNIGIGYNLYRMKLRSSDQGLDGFIDIGHQGPVLFMGYNF